MERTMKNNYEDGWEELSESSQESIQLVSLYRHDHGRPILDHQYSLQPDMATGWTPKLPSCPIPLTYQNYLIEAVVKKIQFDSRYTVVYRGPRHINSVQLHNSNHYRWKYRQKYEVKINAISDAINQVGKEDSSRFATRRHLRENSFQSQIGFDSDFQSGNLDVAVRVKPAEFDCFIRSDTNTRGHTNWYYFKVTNQKYVGSVQFNICNIVKQKNLYSRGMTPYTSSKMIDRPYQSEDQWRQNECFDIQFVQRLCRYGTNRTENQLQFKYDFKQENMEVSFAYSIPYTYSYLQDYIEGIKEHSFVKVDTLCQSFSGIELPLIQISKGQRVAGKVNLLIVGRIHPGETNASHMLEGFINSLLQNSSMAHRLLSSANFYIVPMINPDGVIAGNYRTSFSGRDLNRCFNELSHFTFPELNGLVDFVKRLRSQRKKMDFFFDFHSHSSKKDLFCYGPQHPQGSLHYFRSRILVNILQKQSSMFSAEKCLYKISEQKKSTARSYMLKHQKIPMTFTFQISNGIYSISKETETTYDKKSLLYAGKIIIMGFSQYFYHYHKDIGKQPKMKVIKFKDERLSFSINQKSYFPMRKSVGGFRSQDNSIVERQSSVRDIKTLMSQILEQKPSLEILNEKESDSESSAQDIQDQELNRLFDKRNNLTLKVDKNPGIYTPVERSSQKMSIRKVKSKKELLKSTVKTIELGMKENIDLGVSQSYYTKYRRNRVYYDETHPKATKRVFESAVEVKKPLKQKKFPILF